MTGRFQSEFDPDELNRITHRGMKKLSRAQFEERQTTEDVGNLKTKQREEDTPVVVIKRFFMRIVDGVLGLFRALLAPPQKKVVQCDNYGHVLKPGWSGPHPKCMECGAAILSLNEVRGATPKADRKDQAGPTPFQQQDRKYVK